MHVILAWILIVAGNPHTPVVETIGPFADQDSCLQVATSRPLIGYKVSCEEVKLAYPK